MDFDKATDNFVEWLKSRGVEISSKIKICDLRSSNQGRGIVAVEPISEDEVLFKIPISACLPSQWSLEMSSDSSRSFEIPELVSGLKMKYDLPEWTAAIISMMCAQKSAEWKPYFDVLPTKLNTPMFWSPEETKDLLQGSYLINQIGKEEADQEHEKLLRTVFKDPNFPADVDVSNANYHWCGSLVMAYAFDVPVEHEIRHENRAAGQPYSDEEVYNSDDPDEEFLEYSADDMKVMIPLADTLNAHTKLNNAHLDMPEDILDADLAKEFRMVSTKPIAAGEQVYNTYGSLSTGELLRRYGYTESPHASYEVVEYSDELLSAQICAQLKISAGTLAERKKRLEQLSGEECPDCHYILKSYEDNELQMYSPGLVLLLNSVQTAELTTSLLKPHAKAETKGQLNEAGKKVLQSVIEARIQEYPPNRALPDPIAGCYTDKSDMCAQLRSLELAILHESLAELKQPSKRRKTVN